MGHLHDADADRRCIPVYEVGAGSEANPPSERSTMRWSYLHNRYRLPSHAHDSSQAQTQGGKLLLDDNPYAAIDACENYYHDEAEGQQSHQDPEIIQNRACA